MTAGTDHSPHRTSTDTTSPALRPRAGMPPTLWPLARVEIARLTRHPLLWTGTSLGILFTAMAIQEMRQKVTSDILGMPVTALCVGLFSMVAAERLTGSFSRSGELVESAPTSRVAHTAALCVSALVPGAIASTWLIFYYSTERRLWTTPDWLFGTLSRSDLAAILTGHTVVAAIGATLLGIAAGRWWRFRGASAALLAGVVVWTIGVIGAFSSEGVPAAWTRWVRLFTPINAFSNPSPDGDGYDTLTGSPKWYLVWLVTLCALAALAALLKGSEGVMRRRLVRVGAALLAVSALTYVLAAAGGNSQVVRTYPDGHRVVLTR